jgi:hypothetical protein
MATTTNYGWTTPDDTALVKDGAAAIRTLGSSVDTTTKALNPSTTLGDIEFRSSTANTNTRLGIGSTGDVLTVSGGVPAWAAPAGGGKVLQVVYASTTTGTTIATNTFTDTTMTATITPSSTGSKILIFAMCAVYASRTSDSIGAVDARIMRGATDVFSTGTSGRFMYIQSPNFTEVAVAGYSPLNYLDAPNTTSATTYKVQGRINPTANSATSTWQLSSCPSNMILLEIGA